MLATQQEVVKAGEAVYVVMEHVYHYVVVGGRKREVEVKFKLWRPSREEPEVSLC